MGNRPFTLPGPRLTMHGQKNPQELSLGNIAKF